MARSPKHPAPDTWAALIHRERVARGWDQAQLSEILGVGQGTISRWENGHLRPSTPMQVRILRLFGLGAQELWTIHQAQADRASAVAS